MIYLKEPGIKNAPQTCKDDTMLVFWVVTDKHTVSIFRAGSSKFLRNFGIYLQAYIALQTTKPTLTFSPP
jgi:hypothetical protein